MEKPTIDRSVAAPLYAQLKQVLLHDIQTSLYEPGQCIPTEHELMKRFQLSRNVVRQAIGELVQEGYLVRQKAKGTFVSTDYPPAHPISPLDTQTSQEDQDIPDRDIQVLSTEVDDADVIEAEWLGVTQGTRIIRIRRLRLMEGRPVTMITSLLRYQNTSFILEHSIGNRSLTKLLSQRFDTRVYRTTRAIEARLASQEECARLELPLGSVVQCVTRRCYNRTNTIIEAGISIYRGDYELSFETFSE